MSPITNQENNTQRLLRLEQRGYSRDGQDISTGRPGRLTVPLRTRSGVPVIAKLYPHGQGEQAFLNMQRLWQSPFGREPGVRGLPEPLDYVAEAGAVITERMEGRVLMGLGHVSPAHLAESMRLLVALHTCGVVPEARRSRRGILRSMDRKLRRIEEIAPQYVDHVQPVVERLHQGHFKDTELACAHGDFSARNVVIGGNRTVLIDWDRLQQADPARDVAYFGVWPWRQAIQRGRMPNRNLLKTAVETYRHFRPDYPLRGQLPFHVGAGLVRMCCSLVELWPEQAYLVPGLAKTALRELEGSS